MLWGMPKEYHIPKYYIKRNSGKICLDFDFSDS